MIDATWDGEVLTISQWAYRCTFHEDGTESWGSDDTSPSVSIRILSALRDAIVELGELRAEVERARADHDLLANHMAEWCVAVSRESEWDGWDEYYKDAAYRPGPLRSLLDDRMARVKREWGFDD